MSRQKYLKDIKSMIKRKRSKNKIIKSVNKFNSTN